MKRFFIYLLIGCAILLPGNGQSFVWAQTIDSNIPVGTTNQLQITIGNVIVPSTTPTGVSQAPGPVIPIGTTDTITITIGTGTLPTPTGSVVPTAPPGTTPSPSPASCEAKAKKIREKSKKILDKAKNTLDRMENIWDRTLSRIKKNQDKSALMKRLASRIKSIDRRHDAVLVSIKSLENILKAMDNCKEARKEGKNFIKKFRTLQPRLDSYKEAVKDIVHDLKEGEKIK